MKKIIIIFFIAIVSSRCYGGEIEEFIKNMEGRKLHVYMDGNKKAIGYGHHILNVDGPYLNSLNIGDSISDDIAEQLFTIDMYRLVIPGLINIKQEIGEYLPSKVYVAFSSLIYNMGERGLRKTLFYNLYKYGYYKEAILTLLNTGVKEKGNIIRREKEALLLLSDFDLEKNKYINHED